MEGDDNNHPNQMNFYDIRARHHTVSYLLNQNQNPNMKDEFIIKLKIENEG